MTERLTGKNARALGLLSPSWHMAQAEAHGISVVMRSFVQVPRKETAVSIQAQVSFLIRQDLGKTSSGKRTLGKKRFVRPKKQ